MASVMARETWTDERLDDLKQAVTEGFADNRGELRAIRTDMREELSAMRTDMREELSAMRTDMREELSAMRTDMRDEFKAVRADTKDGFTAVRAEIGELRGEIAAQGRSFQQLTWGLIGAMLVGFLGTIAAIVTQL